MSAYINDNNSISITTGANNTVQGWLNSTPIYGTITATNITAPTTKKEEPAMAEIKGGAPEQSLFTRYVQTAKGYVGQVVYGDPSRKDAGNIVWESDHPQKHRIASRAKDKALQIADKALEKALASIFEMIEVDPAIDLDPDYTDEG